MSGTKENLTGPTVVAEPEEWQDRRRSGVNFGGPTSKRQNMGVSIAQARKAKSEAARVFTQYGELAGVGITRGADGFALKVNFTEQPSDPENLPPDIEGVPVQIDVIGRVRAQPIGGGSAPQAKSQPKSQRKNKAAPAHKG
jgi:hypothetical protein